MNSAGSTPWSLHMAMMDKTTAWFWPAASCPTNRAFLRRSATILSADAEGLLSSGMLASGGKERPRERGPMLVEEQESTVPAASSTVASAARSLSVSP